MGPNNVNSAPTIATLRRLGGINTIAAPIPVLIVMPNRPNRELTVDTVRQSEVA